MNWQAGQPIAPKMPLTTAAKTAGITPTSRGWVTFVDRTSISFYIGRTQGWIEARCPLDIFAANFNLRKDGINSSAYIRNAHYIKSFPADFLR